MNFNNLTRVEHDTEYLTQRGLYNQQTLGHLFDSQNYVCNDQEASRLALNQPGFLLKGVQPGSLGCDTNIYESLLYSEKAYTKPWRGKLGLSKRTYLTIPYLGRGSYNPDVHNRLRIGDPINRNVTYSETHGINEYPFIDIVKETISNPENYLKDDMWTRGGEASRELYKDYTYRSVGSK